MIAKWVIFKRDYLEISFLRENCGYDGSDERMTEVTKDTGMRLPPKMGIYPTIELHVCT